MAVLRSHSSRASRYRNGRDTAKAKAEENRQEEMCSPKYVPEPWEEWRERLNNWSGGHDVYRETYDIAREIPVDMLAERVEPRRWWKA